MKEQVNIRLEEDLIRDIDIYLAKKGQKNRSELIEAILRDFLKSVEGGVGGYNSNPDNYSGPEMRR